MTAVPGVECLETLTRIIIRRPDDAVEANDTHNAYNAAPNAGE